MQLICSCIGYNLQMEISEKIKRKNKPYFLTLESLVSFILWKRLKGLQTYIRFIRSFVRYQYSMKLGLKISIDS
jgi:hypothetical protein